MKNNSLFSFPGNLVKKSNVSAALSESKAAKMYEKKKISCYEFSENGL